MIELGKVLQATGIDRNRFNYLYGLGRDNPGPGEIEVLATPYRETKPGTARLLTRENFLELYFVTLLTAAGIILPYAAQVTRRLMKAEKQGVLDRWWVLPNDHVGKVPTDGLKFEDGRISLNKLATKYAPARTGSSLDRQPQLLRVAAINLHEIVDQVDELMERHDVED